MTFVRTLLLGSALALPVAALSIIPAATPADAAPMRVKHQSAKSVHQVRAKATCGTFMYRKGGKCLDARLKPKK